MRVLAGGGALERMRRRRRGGGEEGPKSAGADPGWPTDQA